MKLEEKTFPIKIKGISKGLEISGFGTVEYSVRNKSGCMVELRAQAYYVPGLPKDLRIISPQGIRTLKGYKGACIACCCDEQDATPNVL